MEEGFLWRAVLVTHLENYLFWFHYVEWHHAQVVGIDCYLVLGHVETVVGYIKAFFAQMKQDLAKTELTKFLKLGNVHQKDSFWSFFRSEKKSFTNFFPSSRIMPELIIVYTHWRSINIIIVIFVREYEYYYYRNYWKDPTICMIIVQSIHILIKKYKNIYFYMPKSNILSSCSMGMGGWGWGLVF